MNIVFCCDNNYLEISKIMITSFLENHKNQTHNIYCVFDEIEEEKISDYCKYLLNYYTTKLIPIKIDSSIFDKCITKAYFTKAMYYRFLLPEMINEDKCLYLDCDIIINSDISELYNSDISEFYLSAIEDSNSTDFEYLFKKWDLPNNIYFNSGVLLLNLKKLRSEVQLKDYFNILENSLNVIKYPDQDVLNIICYNKVLYMEPTKFNRMSFNHEILNKSEYQSLLKQCKIYHFCGSEKPWQYTFHGKTKKVFDFYKKIYLTNNQSENKGSLREKIVFSFKKLFSKAMLKWLLKKFKLM
ncbi:MAG: glycosyltransferase family 8 protein [Clostridia bacterium]